MALDPMAQELVNETMTALQAAPFKRNTEVLISPRRMRALILFTQQRLVWQFNGLHITLVEDNGAPELASAIEAATQLPDLPEPVLPPAVVPPLPSKANGKKGKHAR